MRKSVAALTFISFLLFVGALLGQFFLSTPYNIIIITALFFFLAIIAFLAGNPARKESFEADEEDGDAPDDEESYESEMVAALNEKLKEKDERLSEKDEEIDNIKRARDILETELAELKKKNEELQDSLPDEKAALSTLLPPEEFNEKGTVDIIDVAHKAVNDLKKSALAAHVRVNVSTAESSLIVKASADRLKILFKNIIDNSVKYMNRDGSLTITISTIDTDIFIVLKDNGEGLSERETRHIFELNFQGSNRISGNGLGLAQARAIVEYYGGTIYAKSNINQGMAIYIQLPTT